MISRTFLFSLLAAIALFYLVLNLFVRLVYPKILFPYRGSSYTESAGIQWTDSADGNRIAMIYRPADDANAPLILYFHGNGEDIGMNDERFEWINRQGFGVLAADYPGYGLSTGLPTAASVRAASDAVALYARDVLGIDPSQTVLWGRSVGGAPALHLAATGGFRGVLLEAAFRSVFSLAPPIPLFIAEPFPNERLIQSVEAPVSIIHGDHDPIIPVSHAHALAKAAGENACLRIIESGSHNDLSFVSEKTFEEALRELKGD